MGRVRKHMSVDQETYDYIRTIQSRRGLATFGAAVEVIVKKHQEEDEGSTLAEGIAVLTANAVLKELMPKFDILRTRTGYADKQTKVMLEVLNSMIIALRLTDSPAVTTDILESEILKGSTQRINDQIEHFKQKKDARKYKKESPSKEVTE